MGVPSGRDLRVADETFFNVGFRGAFGFLIVVWVSVNNVCPRF